MKQTIIQLLLCTWALLPLSTAFQDYKPCVFPFIYRGRYYPTCTRDGSRFDMLWCATTGNYDIDHKWKKCYETEHGGNSHGEPCVFPFIYRKRKFYSCTDDNTRPRRFWCATTSNYDKDKKWSYCADTIHFESLMNQERIELTTQGSSMPEKSRQEDAEKHHHK